LWNVANFTGNGNGFKLGGAGTLGRHTLKNCLAFDNHSKGFDHNGSLGGHTLYNCTGFRNAKWNFSFYDTPTNGTNDFRNDLSYLGLGTKGTNIVPSSIMFSNSWQGFTVTAADFISLDSALAMAPRNADFSLPTNGFARLAAGSSLIDNGLEVGLPYNGSAPDLGAYEYVPPTVPLAFASDQTSFSVSNGCFSARLIGLTGHGPAIVYASTNLAAWAPLLTNPPTTGSLLFQDFDVTNWPRRFYRAEER
jgi:hypothetical protein